MPMFRQPARCLKAFVPPCAGHWPLLVVALWGLLVGAGTVGLWRHQTGAAVARPTVPLNLPVVAASLLPERPADRPLLLLFAHPRCSCTRASLNELARIIAQCPELAPVKVIFSVETPPGTPAKQIDALWHESALRNSARAMRGVEVIRDDGFQLARKFGVNTSGHVLLYDERGRLEFSGGITASRGHEGWSDGRSAITNRDGRQPSAACFATPVYGCSLITPCERAAWEAR